LTSFQNWGPTSLPVLACSEEDLARLAAGRLVRPFELSLPAGFAYYVVYPPRALKRPKVNAVRDWLMAEAR
jgi:DNA-binding transcriptional LysR family regulator